MHDVQQDIVRNKMFPVLRHGQDESDVLKRIKRRVSLDIQTHNRREIMHYLAQFNNTTLPLPLFHQRERPITAVNHICDVLFAVRSGCCQNAQAAIMMGRSIVIQQQQPDECNAALQDAADALREHMVT